MRKTIGKIAFWCPAWLFFILIGLIFLIALSACGGDSTKPMPTFTPEQQEYRKCLVQETRLDRSDENLDRAVIFCKSSLGSGKQP